MKQTLIILTLCIMASTTSYAQTAFDGKTYEGLISKRQIDGVRGTLNEDGTFVQIGVVGHISDYFILTFEKDSVSISKRIKKVGSIFQNEEDEILSEQGKYPYRLINQTIKIEKFRMYDFQQEQKTFTLRIENEGQTLIVEQKTNPFFMREVSFQRICTENKKINSQ